jgi:hypothetical protein
MSDKLKEDLRYWSNQLKYAQDHQWGELRVNTEKVCRAMIDLYLDMANAENAK